MSGGYSAWISRAREIEGIYPTEREICRNAHIYWYKLNGFIAKNPVKSTPIHWWTQYLSSFGHHCLSLQKPSVSLSCGKGMTIKPIYRWFGSIHSREGDSIAILNYQGEIQWNVPMKYPEWSFFHVKNLPKPISSIYWSFVPWPAEKNIQGSNNWRSDETRPAVLGPRDQTPLCAGKVHMELS